MSFLLRDRGPSPLRQLLPKLALLASSLVFTLLVTEASLRVAFYHSKDFAMEMWKYAVQLKQPVSNPDLSFVHVPMVMRSLWVWMWASIRRACETMNIPSLSRQKLTGL